MQIFAFKKISINDFSSSGPVSSRRLFKCWIFWRKHKIIFVFSDFVLDAVIAEVLIFSKRKHCLSYVVNTVIDDDLSMQRTSESSATELSRLSWWRHQMETFSALLAICAGNSPVRGEFPAQRPVTRSFDVFFDLCPNKRLSKQSRGWWFGTPSRQLWRHRNVLEYFDVGTKGLSQCKGVNCSV